MSLFQKYLSSIVRERAENSLHFSQGANSKMIVLYAEKSGFTHYDLDKWGHAYPFFPCVSRTVTHGSQNICREFLWRYISYKTDSRIHLKIAIREGFCFITLLRNCDCHCFAFNVLTCKKQVY